MSENNKTGTAFRVCGVEPSFGVRSLLTDRVQAGARRWIVGFEEKVGLGQS